MSAEVKKVKESTQETQNQLKGLVPNKWKEKGGQIHKGDSLTLHQALYNAAVNLDIAGVAELINAGADPNKAILGIKDPINPPYPSFKSIINEEEEDYPDFPMERYHFNAVSKVISYEFFDPIKNDGTYIYGTKDKEKESVLILLLKGGAIPSRCVSSRGIQMDSLLCSSWRYDKLSEIIMEEIRCVSEAIYFEKTSDAGIQNLYLYEDCANRASNFHTHFGITEQIEGAKRYLWEDPYDQHTSNILKINEGILNKWQAKVLTPIQNRMKHAVRHQVFEPYTSIKSELGQKIPIGVLCIIANYLDTSLNSKFHAAFTQMHRLRFDALEERPSKALTISWNKFHKVAVKAQFLNGKNGLHEKGIEIDHKDKENTRVAIHERIKQQTSG